MEHLALSMIAAMPLLPLAAASAAEEHRPRPSAGVFPITFWAMHYWRSSPEYSKLITDEQYQLIRDCNFNLVMGGLLNQAERFGLQCMSDAVTGEEFRELWWTPNEAVTDAQRRKIVAAISAVDRSSPALWGYHLCDEPAIVSPAPRMERSPRPYRLTEGGDPPCEATVCRRSASWWSCSCSCHSSGAISVTGCPLR